MPRLGKIVAAIKAARRASARPERRQPTTALEPDCGQCLDVKMIDRHRDQISDTAERTSERRNKPRPSLENSRAGLHRLKRPGDLTALCPGLNYHPPSTLLRT